MSKVKKVFKYGTGDVIPEGAVYLSTIVEDRNQHINGGGSPRYVWHYFLVEVDE